MAKSSKQTLWIPKGFLQMLILHVESLSECFFVVCCHVLDDKLLQKQSAVNSKIFWDKKKLQINSTGHLVSVISKDMRSELVWKNLLIRTLSLSSQNT